jgi:hypothetical protein
MTMRPDGTVVSSAATVNEGDELMTRFRDGTCPLDGRTWDGFVSRRGEGGVLRPG